MCAMNLNETIMESKVPAAQTLTVKARAPYKSERMGRRRGRGALEYHFRLTALPENRKGAVHEYRHSPF